ncbi:MAG: type II toxin-antitoxin system RelE/ParE family toxin [Rudaea sp.]|uniref:type II toxin-antitoxin system RelE/ParE family toxin n=1 Tax=Rudaea sp. TaxID=2136325 RepID=UPI0039E6BD71
MTAAHRVRLTARARRDLRAIAQYIARENPARARSFAAELRNPIEAYASYAQRERFEIQTEALPPTGLAAL